MEPERKKNCFSFGGTPSITGCPVPKKKSILVYLLVTARHPNATRHPNALRYLYENDRELFDWEALFYKTQEDVIFPAVIEEVQEEEDTTEGFETTYVTEVKKTFYELRDDWTGETRNNVGQVLKHATNR